LRSGKRLEPTGEAGIELSVGPGRAAILMQGPEDALRRVRRELKIE